MDERIHPLSSHIQLPLWGFPAGLGLPILVFTAQGKKRKTQRWGAVGDTEPSSSHAPQKIGFKDRVEVLRRFPGRFRPLLELLKFYSESNQIDERVDAQFLQQLLPPLLHRA